MPAAVRSRPSATAKACRSWAASWRSSAVCRQVRLPARTPTSTAAAARRASRGAGRLPRARQSGRRPDLGRLTNRQVLVESVNERLTVPVA